MSDKLSSKMVGSLKNYLRYNCGLSATDEFIHSLFGNDENIADFLDDEVSLESQFKIHFIIETKFAGEYWKEDNPSSQYDSYDEFEKAYVENINKTNGIEIIA